MKGRSYLLSSLSAFAFGASAASLQPISIKGSKFFNADGSQFFIKGVAYQQGVDAGGSTSTSNNTVYNDPLADGAACSRDIPFLQKLGTNLVRTYAIDPTQDHSACMEALDAAGIYVISDLSEPNLSINRASPAWDTELYARYTAVVDSLAPYSNVIGFFAGNEVTNNASYTEASAFVKAAVRDTKAYIKARGYRSSLSVGYAADDDPSVRENVANYFNCGDLADTIDFWGYNIYSWCGDSNYVLSGYINRTQEFANYSAPVFFSEYGCNTVAGGAGRIFTEVASLYGAQMSQVFSGGIVYEYFEEANDYGLVSIEGNSVSTLADYNALATQISSVTVTGVNSGSYNPTNTAQQACPTVDSTWLVAPTGLPPTPDQDVCSCMVASLTCVAQSSISDTEIGTLFSEVCGYNNGKPCAGFAANTTTGVYGAYLMCNATEKLSLAFNTYFIEQGSASGACNFGGNALQVKAAGSTGSCSSIISKASAAQTATGSSTGASAAATTKKKGAASAAYTPASISFGGLSIGAYFVGMLVTGGLMVLL